MHSIGARIRGFSIASMLLLASGFGAVQLLSAGAPGAPAVEEAKATVGGAPQSPVLAIRQNGLTLSIPCLGRAATKVGTPKADTIVGTRKRDVIAGLGGNDVIKGMGGNDMICGGSGNDRISGGSGSDRLAGGSGRDRLYGRSGNDGLDGGSDRDSCSGGTGRDRARRCERRSGI